MKFILILILLSACSKTVTVSRTSVNPLPNSAQALSSSYMVISENDSVEYSSQNVRIVEVVGEELFYTIGLMNNYQKDKLGQNRVGIHPNTEFRIQTARYRIVPVADKVRLEFVQSSCADTSINPFSSIIPSTEITLSQLPDKISLKQSATEEDVLFKAESNEIEPLWESNVLRILCGDETND